MTGDLMVSIFFFLNTNDSFDVPINIVKNLFWRRKTKLGFQLVAPNL